MPSLTIVVSAVLDRRTDGRTDRMRDVDDRYTQRHVTTVTIKTMLIVTGHHEKVVKRVRCCHLLQVYSANKRLGGCCVYVVTSHSSRDLRDVNSVFAVTVETGIVYVSERETLDELQDDNITVCLYVYVNSTGDDEGHDSGDINDDGESESLRSRWLSVANISVHVERVDTVYNVTSYTERKRSHQ